MLRSFFPFSAKDLAFLIPLWALGIFVQVRGIGHLGYVGQDFNYHHDILLSYPAGYRFSLTNPPGLYWLGQLIRHLVGPAQGLPALALTFVALNALALGVLYGLLWQSVALPPLRWAAAALVTLVPFRLVQSVVFAADAFTIPIFILTACFSLRLFHDPRRILPWVGLCLTLCVGMVCKYTVIGLLPAIALLLGSAIFRQVNGPARWKWAALGGFALAAPAAIFCLETGKGGGLHSHWLAPGEPAVMRWSDILLLKKNDRAVFSAPEYYRDEVYDYRKFSYAGLLHLSALTDCQSFFQSPPPDFDRAAFTRAPYEFRHVRSPRSQWLQSWSVRWSLPFSLLAVLGTVACAVLTGIALFRPVPLLSSGLMVLTLLALGFYAPIFLNLHRVGDPYTAGYWVARLVMPALLVFYLLGFVLVDLACRRFASPAAARRIALGVAGYTFVGCALFVSFLV
jgi:hypothetical protein